MTVQISAKIKEKMFDAMKLYGYRTDKEFIEDALRRRILDFKKIEFFRGIKIIKEKLAKKRLGEEDILRDFEKFCHR